MRPGPISTAASIISPGSLAHDAEIAYAQIESEMLHERVAALEGQLAQDSSALSPDPAMTSS